MIKIIKDGVKPKRARAFYKATCNWCGCEFVFEHVDFFALEKRPNGNATIICPYCGNNITKRISQYEQIVVEVEEEC